MSKHHGIVTPTVIEWSPRKVRVFDAASNSNYEFETLKEASGVVGGKPVTIAIGRRNIFMRSIRLPNAPLDDLRPLVQMRLNEMFPVGAADLAYDVAQLDDITSAGRLTLVIAMPSSDLRQVLTEAKSSGIKIARVVPVSIGSVLVASSSGKADCAVVSEDLSGIGIDIVAGPALVASRVTVNSSALGDEVCRTHQVAGLPCGDSIAAGGIAFPEAKLQNRQSPLEMLAGPGGADIAINLRLPEDVLAEVEKAKRGSISRAGIFVAGAVVLWGALIMEYSDKKSAVTSFEARNADRQKKLAKVQKDAEAEANKVTALASGVTQSFKMAQTFGDLVVAVNNQVPPNVWLTGISVERGKEIQIRGTAKNSVDVAAYTTNLKKEARLRDVHLSFSNTAQIDKVPVTQFSISAFPVGNLPLFDFKDKKK